MFDIIGKAHRQTWRLMEEGWVKFNCDGVVTRDLHVSCGGVEGCNGPVDQRFQHKHGESSVC